MKQFFISALLLFFSFSAVGQSNYKPGLVVKSPGDTLRGFINYKEWEENPVQISFKTSISEKETQEFTTKNCSYFSITGLESYLRYEGEISADRIDLDNLPTRVSTKTRYVSTFLKVLQQGPYVSLYSFTDLLKTRYFLQAGKTSAVEELGYKRFIDANNNIATVRLYTAQLNKAAATYNKAEEAEIKRLIDASKYTGTDLLRIVSLINGFSLETIKLAENQNNVVAFFAGVGLNRSLTKAYEQGNITNLAVGSLSPKVAFGFDTYLNPKIQRFVFRGELSFTMANQKLEFSRAENRNIFYHSLSFKQITATLTPQIIYNIFNAENLKVYGGSGIAVNYSVYPDFTYSETNTNNEINKDAFEKEDLYKVWFAVPFRVGAVICKKTDISILYFLRSSLIPHLDYTLEMGSLHVQANYFFNRK